jgi:hypothetical protein
LHAIHTNLIAKEIEFVTNAQRGLLMISINQPYFFPNLGYFQMLSASRHHIFMDCVNMPKKSWVTRNKFGSEKIFSVKLRKLSQNKKINNHFFVSFQDFKQEFLSLISARLSNLKYFHEIMSLIETVFNKTSNDPSISELNIIATKCICEAFEFNIKFNLLSNFEYRGVSSDDLLILICKKNGYSDYINLENGKNLYCERKFSKCGIKLYFNNTIEAQNMLPDDFFQSILVVIGKYGIAATKTILESLKNKSNVK